MAFGVEYGATWLVQGNWRDFPYLRVTYDYQNTGTTYALIYWGDVAPIPPIGQTHFDSEVHYDGGPAQIERWLTPDNPNHPLYPIEGDWEWTTKPIARQIDASSPLLDASRFHIRLVYADGQNMYAKFRDIHRCHARMREAIP